MQNKAFRNGFLLHGTGFRFARDFWSVCRSGRPGHSRVMHILELSIIIAARCLFSSARSKTIWPTHADRGEAWKWKKCGVMGRHGVEKKKNHSDYLMLTRESINRQFWKQTAEWWRKIKIMMNCDRRRRRCGMEEADSLLERLPIVESHLRQQKLSIAWSSRGRDSERLCIASNQREAIRRIVLPLDGIPRRLSGNCFRAPRKSERDCSVH